MSCISELLNKFNNFSQYEFNFQLSIFRYVSRDEREITLPSQELEKFNWSRVTIETPKFQRVSPAVVSGIGKMPILPILWLKKSQDCLEYISIGSRLKIKDSLESLNFCKLKTVKFECWDVRSAHIWRPFLIRHRKVIEDLTLAHCLLLYDYTVMKVLKRLEFNVFTYVKFPPLAYLLTQNIELILKGDAYECVLIECTALGENRTYPNVTIAQIRPRRNILVVLMTRFKIKFIPLQTWENFILLNR
ncbi:hypothetical protein DFJ63DRAFT_311817 [Scheffersomyces coipomensis]|uniref:uncharacterized protein n=1 Tax=Scheffersomyces coipomensis TaxID=1788519 RepID=UPI00315D10DF